MCERDVDDRVVEVVDEAAAEVVAQARSAPPSSIPCNATYGIGANTSAAGPSARNGSIASAPASRSPHQQPTIATAFWPTSSGGTNGSGGAVMIAASIEASSGASAAQSRNTVSTSLPRSRGNSSSPPRIVDTGWRVNSKRDTIPKLPPPPRSPHSRSGRSSSLAGKTSPSAVTTSAPTRLSHDSPYLRCSQPMPPPSVRPATPVVEIRPPVVASPCAAVAASRSAQVAPGCTVAVPPADVDLDAAHRREVDDHPAVAGAQPGHAVSAASHREWNPRGPRQRHGRDDVLGRTAPRDQRRPGVDGAVPDSLERRRSQDQLARRPCPRMSCANDWATWSVVRCGHLSPFLKPSWGS